MNRCFFLAAFFLGVLTTFHLPAQELDVSDNQGPVKMHTWRASWITHPTASVLDYGVFHLRRKVNLSQKPEKLVVYVSGDNRYRLFVNGQSVCFGPARGDKMNWRYETVDIAPYLKQGENILAVLLVNFGAKAPVAQIGVETRFILQAENEDNAFLDTDERWKIFKNVAYTPILYHSKTGYYACGPTDRVNGVFYPWGWKKAEFADRGWLPGKVLAKGHGRGFIYGNSTYLVPRQIPFMEETEERINRIARSAGIPPDESFFKGNGQVVVPPRTKMSFLLDMSYETIGYPHLKVSKGKDSQITLTYAETLYNEDMQKGPRNEVKGRKIVGYKDVFIPDGGQEREFVPLWLRTFRYIQLDIETAAESLVLQDFYNVFTAYPFERKAGFESNEQILTRIWDVSWRTARLCAGETYMDCPYYEQLNYIGDTRIQALVSLYVSGDDRLMRDAIRQFDDSRLPNGLTMSRYPTEVTQIIPPYSLFWIAMLHDYHMHREDQEFIETMLPGVEPILQWFERHLGDDNLLGAMPWWQFTDWAKEFGSGIPPSADSGQSANLTAQFVYALKHAAALYKAYGYPEKAVYWEEKAKSIKNALMETCYVPNRKLLAEQPDKSSFSQHTNLMGILSDILPPSVQKAAMRAILEDKDLIEATIYFKFYLFRALKKTGMAGEYTRQLGPWKVMLAQGVTTFGETGRPSTQRSECHAWSASPNFDFLNTICGFAPSSPGFKTIEIAPALGDLKTLNASMPHPNGMVKLELKASGSGVTGAVELPEGLSGHFIWKGQKKELSAGRQRVAFD